MNWCQRQLFSVTFLLWAHTLGTTVKSSTWHKELSKWILKLLLLCNRNVEVLYDNCLRKFEKDDHAVVTASTCLYSLYEDCLRFTMLLGCGGDFIWILGAILAGNLPSSLNLSILILFSVKRSPKFTLYSDSGLKRKILRNSIKWACLVKSEIRN